MMKVEVVGIFLPTIFLPIRKGRKISGKKMCITSTFIIPCWIFCCSPLPLSPSPSHLFSPSRLLSQFSGSRFEVGDFSGVPHNVPRLGAICQPVKQVF